MNDDQFQEPKQLISGVEERLGSRIDGVESHLSGVEDGQASFAERLSGVEDGQSILANRMDKMEARLDTRMDNIESKLTSVRDDVGHLRDDMNRRFDEAAAVQNEIVKGVSDHAEERDATLEDHEQRLVRLERQAA